MKAWARLGAAALALVVAAAVAPVAASPLAPGFVARAGIDLGHAAVHGSSVVWFDSASSLQILDLAGGTTRALTDLPPGTQVQSVAFDGKWVAWCDDRFGNPDCFALEVKSGALARLSNSPKPDTGIAVGGGHAAWVNEGRLMGADLSSPNAHPLEDLAGAALAPQIEGDVVVWVQSVGAQSHLATLRWGGNATLLTTDSSRLDGAPALSGARIAWKSLAWVEATPTRAAYPAGDQVRAAQLAGTLLLHVGNLTGPGHHGSPVLGGGWVAWIDAVEGKPGPLVAVELSTARELDVPGPIRLALASDSYLLVAPADGSATQVLAWSDAGGPSPHRLPVPSPVVFLALLLVLALSQARRA